MTEPTFKVKEENVTKGFGEFVIEPLETGYGHTLGNALRRVLLTSIPGAAVTSVKITGVKHRFSAVPGLKENVIDFLLNVKELQFAMPENKTTATAKISVKGPREVTGADIEATDGVEVINKDFVLGHLDDKKGKFEVEFTVEKGFGYSLSEERKIGTVGTLSCDAIFSPVTRVNYSVEATRVGRLTNLDKLVLQVWTNGTISPRLALDTASKVLASYFSQVYAPTSGVSVSAGGSAATSAVSEDLLKLTIDELDLPTRIYNSLRNGGIETLGQLLQAPKKELMSMRNMGGKSIAIIEEKLQEKGISLNI